RLRSGLTQRPALEHDGTGVASRPQRHETAVGDLCGGGIAQQYFCGGHDGLATGVFVRRHGQIGHCGIAVEHGDRAQQRWDVPNAIAALGRVLMGTSASGKDAR
ncbi:MAG: hypothetical protein AAF138_10640, partial [Planctomycetota bacterium]